MTITGWGRSRITGALVAIGAMGGSRGQSMLKRLKRLGGRTAVICLLLSPLTPLLPWPDSGVWFGIAIIFTILGFVVWCYAAFARWLTRDGEITR